MIGAGAFVKSSLRQGTVFIYYLVAKISPNFLRYSFLLSDALLASYSKNLISEVRFNPGGGGTSGLAILLKCGGLETIVIASFVVNQSIQILALAVLGPP